MVWVVVVFASIALIPCRSYGKVVVHLASLALSSCRGLVVVAWPCFNSLALCINELLFVSMVC